MLNEAKDQKNTLRKLEILEAENKKLKDLVR